MALVPGALETTALLIDDPTAGPLRARPGPARTSVVEEQVWIGERLFAHR